MRCRVNRELNAFGIYTHMRRKRNSGLILYMKHLVLRPTSAHLVAVGVRPNDRVEQLAVGGEVHQDQPTLHAQN